MEIDKRKLEIAMANACMSAGKLAECSNITLTSLSRIKNGKYKPRPVTVGKIAMALNVDVEKLLVDETKVEVRYAAMS